MDAGRNLLAEAIGTFFLCFAGIAAILSTQEPINSGTGLVGIALAHGLALSVAVNALFGPALVYGDFGLHHYYWVAPVAGAIVAALIYHHVLLEDESDG